MLVVEENYVFGIPQTAVDGWAPRGADWHWSAGENGRAGWEGTIRHLVATRWTVNASYHGGFWAEHDAAHRACRTVLQWIVPTTKAAHSVNPANCWKYHADKPRALQDARFAEVRRILARDSDPNADSLAIAYAGMPADLARDLACGVFRADLRNLAAQLVGHPTIVDRPHFAHGWIQPISRYEMDSAPIGGSDLLIAMLYAAAGPAQEDDMLNDYLRGGEILVNRTARLRKGATPRTLPLFDPSDYDAHRAFPPLTADSDAPAIRWVTGSNITLADGTVHDPRTRWLATQSGRYGIVFYHEADVLELRPTEVVEVATGITPEQVDQARRAGFFTGRDRGLAEYERAGREAAQQVTP